MISQILTLPLRVLTACFALCCTAQAATFTVTTTADEFDTPSGTNLSLREAVRDAAAADTINFNPSLSGQTILFISTNSSILLNKNLTIDASSLPAGIQLNGNNHSRLFEVASSTTVTLTSLTITNGRHIYSGADFNNGKPNGGSGILNQGNLTLNRCSVVGNRLGSAGFASATGGGIVSLGGEMTANQCTFAGNEAADGGSGGALYAFSGMVTLNHCTLVGNTAFHGGGFFPPATNR